MDKPTVSEIVDDVLDNMLGNEAFKDDELIPWLSECVVTGTDEQIDASGMDKVLVALQNRIQAILQEAHFATRGKGL